MHEGGVITPIPPKPRILLVEDEALMRGHLARVLATNTSWIRPATDETSSSP